MRCVECEGEHLHYCRVPHAGALSDGRTYVAPVMALRCATCGQTYACKSDIDNTEIVIQHASVKPADLRVSA